MAQSKALGNVFKLQGIVNIMDPAYGAKADGATDNSTAIQAAISTNAAQVIIPEGVFNFGTKLNLIEGQVITGAGVGGPSSLGTRLVFTGTGDAMMLTSSAGVYREGVALRGFRITGPGATSTGSGIRLQGPVQVTSYLQDIIAAGFSAGIRIDDGISASLFRVRSKGNTGTDGRGFQISKSNAIQMLYCEAESNNGAGLHVSAGGGSAGENNGILIIGGRFETNGLAGGGGEISDIFIRDRSNVHILGPWISTEGRAGITLDTVTGGVIGGGFYITDGGAVSTLIGIECVGVSSVKIRDGEIEGFTSGSRVAVNFNASSTKNKIDGVMNAASDIIVTDNGTLNQHIKQAGGFVQTKAPQARVTKGSAQSINDSTLTALTFDTETFDVGGLHDNSTNNSRLTAPIAGKYRVSGTVDFAANATGLRRARILKNGTNSYADVIVNNNGSGAVQTRIPVTALVNLAAAEYVELQAEQRSTGALNVETDATSFEMEWVGE